MLHISSVSFLVCFMMAAGVYAEDMSGGNPTGITYKSSVMLLEQEWKSTRDLSYFGKAVRLFQEARANTPVKDIEFLTVHLDLASGVLLKSRCGIEFGATGTAVRANQAWIVDELAGADIGQLKDLAAWPELRARYARLLMFERARWISLHDPSLDGEVPIGDSLASWGLDAEARERLERERLARRQKNMRVQVQQDLKRAMRDNGPAIDRFMIAAFSTEPEEFRMLNELLAMGLYTPKERSKLVATVAGNIKKLPDMVKIQLP